MRTDAVRLNWTPVCRLTISIQDRPLHQRVHIGTLGRRLGPNCRGRTLAGGTRTGCVLQPALRLDVLCPDFGKLGQIGLAIRIIGRDTGRVVRHADVAAPAADAYGQKTSSTRENDLRSEAIVVIDDAAQHRAPSRATKPRATATVDGKDDQVHSPPRCQV